MSMSKFERVLSHLKEAAQEIENKNVIKSIPMKPEWKKMYTELQEVSDQEDALAAKRKTLKAAFWSKVEIDTGLFGTEMRLNQETGEVEVYADED